MASDPDDDIEDDGYDLLFESDDEKPVVPKPSPGRDYFNSNEFNSIFRCTDIQHQAILYIVSESKRLSEAARPTILSRFQTLGFDEAVLDRVIEYIKNEAPLIIHVNLSRTLQHLIRDTHYRNQFEVLSSGGSLNPNGRVAWEDRMFNSIYHYAKPTERVKYGVLNVLNDPYGIPSCAGYGESFLLLKNVRLRTSFASGDTASNVKIGSCEHYLHVLNEYTPQELEETISVAIGLKPYSSASINSIYKETQYHGDIQLNRDVEALVVGKCHTRSSPMARLCEQFSKVHGVPLIYQSDL